MPCSQAERLGGCGPEWACELGWWRAAAGDYSG
jgi:hypothetical protein